jgi:hypothetical protein
VAIELKNLSADERLALVALTEIIVGSDSHASDEEESSVHDLAAAIGEAEYARVIDEIEQRLPDEDTLRDFLETITRQEARELIYGKVLEEAIADSLNNREVELFEWLAETWDITTKIEDES